MKLSINLGYWTRMKTALAVAGVLAVAGAVGSAIAMSPSVSPPIKWQGGVEFMDGTSGGFQVLRLYTVPIGRSFLLTDLVVMNDGVSARRFAIHSDPDGVCTVDDFVLRFGDAIVPPGNNTVLAFQTGIGFGAGNAVCVATTDPLAFSGRGFLFTPQPAS